MLGLAGQKVYLDDSLLECKAILIGANPFHVAQATMLVSTFDSGETGLESSIRTKGLEDLLFTYIIVDAVIVTLQGGGFPEGFDRALGERVPNAP